MATETLATKKSADTTPQRRKRDPEATRVAILDAAEELFIRRGLADTPTSRIARRAGVTKSLIHHHFGSKEALWDAIKKRHFGQYYEIQKEMLAGSAPTADLLRDSIVTYFRFLQDDPRSVRFMSWRFAEADDPCLDQEDELFALGVDKLRQGQEAGELRPDVEPLSMIKAFLALVDHWFLSKPLLAQMIDSEAEMQAAEENYLEDVVRIFFEGVKPRPE